MFSKSTTVLEAEIIAVLMLVTEFCRFCIIIAAVVV